MKRRQWDARVKAEIVVQGLKGRAVADICSEHKISQAQYYQWRDQFLANASVVFESNGQSKREDYLKRENERLKRLVGELTMELKKTEEVLG